MAAKVPKLPPIAKAPPGQIKKKRPRGPDYAWVFNDGSSGTGGVGALARLSPYRILGLGFTPPSGAMGVVGSKLRYHYDPRVGGYCMVNDINGGGSDGAWADPVAVPSFTGALSMGCWFYETAQPEEPFGGFVMSRLGVNDGTNNKQNFSLVISPIAHSHNVLALYSTGAAFQLCYGTSVIQLLRWNFLFMTYDGSSVMKVYVNGQLEGTLACSGAQDTTNVLGWELGGFQQIGITQRCHGYYWNAMIFTREVKAYEIKTMFYNPFDDIFDPPVLPPAEPPPPPPPPGGGAAIYTTLIGKSATPISGTEQIISNRGGQKPML